jgi:carboxypeptidase Taq
MIRADPSTELHADLAQHARHIWALERALELAVWDQRTMMPPGGTDARSRVMAALARAVHESWIDPTLATLLDDLHSLEQAMEHESVPASLIRFMRREHTRRAALPTALLAERAQAAVASYSAWLHARSTSRFQDFALGLQRQLTLARAYATYFDVEEPYDALIDQFEPGVTTADLRRIFNALRPELSRLIDAPPAIVSSDPSPRVPPHLQRELEHIVLQRLGFRAGQWRLDESPHPFASFQGSNDIRLATRYPDTGTSLLSSMHEAGHGLYEHNVDPELQETPLCAGASAAFHESQSRLFENFVGRRRAFWRWLYPELQRLVPDPYRSVTPETYHRSLHDVRPSPLRIGSDEVSYLLHIILRFEIEVDLIAGRVEVPDLPELWNTKTRAYLGVEPQDDARGVLQDVHWARGRFGYFPSYALGDVVAAQIWGALERANPDLDDELAKGELVPICEWLRSNVWRHGSKFLPRELLGRIVGDDFNPKPLVHHLDTRLR